jgi:D-alanyl-D-alanine dipeptidase
MWYWTAAQPPHRDRAEGPAPHLYKGTVLATFTLALAAALGGCAAPSFGPKQAMSTSLPPGFVHLHGVAPDVRQDMRYHGSRNFLGRPVAGYQAPSCILSERAARALQAAQVEVRPLGLTFKVFDCYRPQTAVNDFMRWGADLADQKTKADYYPSVPKAELFQRGYIAEKSGHSRGSTVDLTLVVVDGPRAAKVVRGPLADGEEVDMGSPFDMFDARSHTDNAEMSPDVQHNRRWLRALLAQHGFRNLPEEWWHYTLADEPFADQYFDFAVAAP